MLDRVAAGEVGETIRVERTGRVVAFGKLDTLAPGYPAAVAAARKLGYEPELRIAGGRAAAFHEGTLTLAHAVRDADARAGIRDRFRSSAELWVGALRRLGVDARVGEVPGEYCPGAWSVNARGRVKLAGFAQRVIGGAAFVGGVLVVEGADGLREVLTDVYAELGIGWDPATVGAVAEEVPGVGTDDAREALLAEYRERDRGRGAA